MGLARASEDTWEKGDAIGFICWMARRRGSEPEVRDGGDREAGSFEAADGGRIYLPSDGTARDFTAYYPYREDLKDWGVLYRPEVAGPAAGH